MMSAPFGVDGTQLLDGLDLPAPYAARIASLRRLMDDVDFEITVFTGIIRGRMAQEPGYTAAGADPRHRPHPGRGPGRRDRRHHPVRLSLEADVLGGSDAQAS